MNILDAAVPSPDAVYSVDLGLNLDLNVNLSVNTTVAFDYPLWTENDILSKELTDSILTENFNNLEERDQLPACDISFNSEQFLSDTSNSAVTSDLIWNTFEGVEEFYYEDIKDFDDSSNEINTPSAETSDLFIYQLDTTGDINSSTNNNSEQKQENVCEPWTDTSGYDVLKDSLFELDLFSECLKDVENISVVPSSNYETVIPDCPIENTSVADWNRRRSLLYDKNEFAKTPDTRSSCHRHPETNSRVKSSTSLGSRGNIPGEPRIYVCPVRDCEKTYCKATHLKSHMRRHSGIKPFICDWDGCKWRFSRSDELARHKRSHSGIKPYSCDLCEKAFSRSDHLSKHAKVHMKKLALYGTPIITKKCNYKYLNINRIPVE